MSKQYHLFTVDCDGAIETFRGDSFEQAAAELISCANTQDYGMTNMVKALSCLSKIAYAIVEAEDNDNELLKFTAKDWDMMDSVEVTWTLETEDDEERCEHTGLTVGEFTCLCGLVEQDDSLVLADLEQEPLDNPFHEETDLPINPSEVW